jgi:L-ribulokinase
MQIYADVIGKPMKVSQSEQTCALGAAIFGAAAAGIDTIGNLQQRVTATRDLVFHPIPENQAIYAELYTLYRNLHDAFGTADWHGRLHHVMKRLLALRS